MPKSLASLVALGVSTSLLLGLACGGAVDGATPDPDGGVTAADGGGGATDASPPDEDVPLVPASKVDLLLVVDNSASMADKAQLLAKSLPTLVKSLAVVNDLHLGVISTSLGTMGGDVCPDGDPARNGLARLRTTGPGGTPIPAASQGFLAYGGGAGATGDLDAFTNDASALVKGVGENGCGFEAQLESAYRFLVQPDPWAKVTVDGNNQATLGSDVDATLLQQRAAFLRPDSLVVVLLLTDEDDSNVDPLSVGGQGWAFASTQFPGSTVFRADGKTTTAPRATSACATNPGSADCTSCGFAATCDASDPACQKIKSDPECQKNNGYYGPNEDQLNVRFHRMKERYGIDPQYPIARYVTGFTSSRVPDRKNEHVETVSNGRRTIGPYVGTPSCTNPLFAAKLPTGAGDELCNLPRGPRSRELVVFATLTGAVPSLTDQLGRDTSRPADWPKLVGANPAAFDFSGIDPHMVPSIAPRPGLPGPTSTRGDNGTDPVHGREWDTQGGDLQYACTFDLPAPHTCSPADPACDCADAARNPPLCAAAPGEQVKAKAYPAPRVLRVAQGLASRGLVGSICPSTSPDYDGTMNTLAARIASRLAK